MSDLTLELTEAFLSSLPSADLPSRLASNALRNASIAEAALDRDIAMGIRHQHQYDLVDYDVTDQKQTGRCWLFAILNVMRDDAMRNNGGRGTAKGTDPDPNGIPVKNFEFSQAHTFFYEKLERANYVLECVSSFPPGTDPSDRELAHLLSNPTEDGGQWNMAVNIIEKYGAVPKDCFPESAATSNSTLLNRVIAERLRRAARDLLDPSLSRSETRRQAMADVHRILTIALGTPPKTVNFGWHAEAKADDAEKGEKSKRWVTTGDITPVEFIHKHLRISLPRFVCLVHDPRNPLHKLYTVKYLGNMVGGARTVYVNVSSEELLRVTHEMITKESSPVWFGCDVGKQFKNDLGIWHERLYDMDGFFGASISGLDKKERLMYGQTLMTHAMTFTGLTLSPGDADPVSRISTLKVQNSWGSEKVGRKGFQTMTKGWFEEHVFEVAAPREVVERVCPHLSQVIDGDEVTELPPWDPMGALARGW